MSSFQEILNKPSEDIKPPKPLPVGTYLCVVDGMPEIKQMGKAGNSAAILKYKFMQPQPDVDQKDLMEVLTEAGKSLQEFSVPENLWLTDAAAFRAKDRLISLGVSSEGKTLGQMLNEVAGHQGYVSISHRPSEDGKTFFMEVKNVATV